MNINYFKEVQTLEQLKKEFRKLVKKYHPDLGGTDEDMKQINNEYDFLAEKLKSTGKHEKEFQNMEAFKEILSKISHLEVDVEICGEWIWISGNTYRYKENLKEVGFSWAKKKKMWYWKPYETKRKPRTSTPMEEIRLKYGSQVVKKEKRPAATGRLPQKLS